MKKINIAALLLFSAAIYRIDSLSTKKIPSIEVVYPGETQTILIDQLPWLQNAIAAKSKLFVFRVSFEFSQKKYFSEMPNEIIYAKHVSSLYINGTPYYDEANSKLTKLNKLRESIPGYITQIEVFVYTPESKKLKFIGRISNASKPTPAHPITTKAAQLTRRRDESLGPARRYPLPKKTD